MRLTGFGLRAGLFYVTMLLAFVATPYSNLFFLLLSFLTLLWLACAWWTPRNLRGVRASLSHVEPIACDGPASFSIDVEGSARRHMQVAAEIWLESGARAFGQVAVLEGRSTLRVQVPPLARGIHRVRKAYLASGYPLGLFEARQALEGLDELVVYPRPTERAETRGGGDTLADVLGELPGGQGDLQPSGLRDHTDRDELRSVHWRASARRGSLVVKEWEGGGGSGLELLLDRRAESAALEQALSQISAVVAYARDNKELLVLTSQGLQATYGEGHRPWREALHFLAAAQALPANSPAPPPVSPSVTRLPAARAVSTPPGREAEQHVG